MRRTVWRTAKHQSLLLAPNPSFPGIRPSMRYWLQIIWRQNEGSMMPLVIPQSLDAAYIPAQSPICRSCAHFQSVEGQNFPNKPVQFTIMAVIINECRIDHDSMKNSSHLLHRDWGFATDEVLLHVRTGISNSARVITVPSKVQEWYIFCSVITNNIFLFRHASLTTWIHFLHPVGPQINKQGRKKPHRSVLQRTTNSHKSCG